MTRYHKPYVAEIADNTALCNYGCGNVALYEFANGKRCCARHYNSCPAKRKNFSELDHSIYTAKSLATRIKTGITKSSQIKGGETRRAQGHYQKLASTMQKHWETSPWNNNPRCPLLEFKGTPVLYQGSYEYDFLTHLEEKHNLEWVANTVRRGPAIWYVDPTDLTKRLYISDFLVHNTIYEIKSSWTWNKNGQDLTLERKNKAKLAAAAKEGYNVVLVLDKEIYEKIMD